MLALLPLLGMIPQALTWIWNCKPLRYAVMAGVAVLATWAYIGHVKHQAATAARTAVIAEVKAATDAESQRRTAVLERAQQAAAVAVAKSASLEQKNKSLTNEINRLSHRHDAEPCLDRDSVRRLRALGQ